MFFFLALLLVFPVWMRGGTRLELMGPVPWFALGLLVALVFAPPARRDETNQAARQRVWHALFSDPVLYVGLAFLLLLTLQWSNGPRAIVYDAGQGRYLFSAPPKPGLALFCVDPREALEMLYWFAPLYALLLAVRNGLLREQKLELMKLTAWNAALAAGFGLVQYLSGTVKLYWVNPAEAYFFAAFGYQNHAGAFFVLTLALGIGLLIRALVRGDAALALPGLLPVLSLTSLAAIFSKSRAAIVMTALLAVAGTIYGFRRVRWRYTSAGRIAALVCLAALLGVSAYVAFVVPRNPVREEMRGTSMEDLAARLDVAEDPLRSTAWAMIGDHPWFGVGGWGYRHFLPLYVKTPPGRHGFPVGAANLHHDPLQFLVEFGAFGVGLLALTVGLVLAPAVRRLRALRKPDPRDPRPWFMKIPPLGLALLVGPALTLVHSFVDLPFRSPAILWTWFAMLACAGDLADRGEEGGHRRAAPRRAGPAEGAAEALERAEEAAGRERI